MPGEVYLNGAYVPYGEAVVPVEDRGNVFADGVYEVIRVYDGRGFAVAPHMERLQRSAAEIRLPTLPLEELTERGLELVRRNKINDGTLYIQVTRGVAPRSHAFPDPEVEPSVFMMAKPAARPDAALFERGVTAVSTPDIRWERCDIKSISLLPNVLAKQKARDEGAFEAVFVKDGVITEGSSTNAFFVRGGRLVTFPAGPGILAGITRNIVVRLAEKQSIAVAYEAVPLDALDEVQEMFITSTTAEVMPVVQLDGKPIGDGRVGAITGQLQKAFATIVDDVRRGDVTFAESSSS